MYKNETGLPSVSDILSPYIEKSFYTDESRNRGEIVHAYAASYLTGLFCPAPPDEWKGYCDSGKRWIDENVDRVVLVEKRLIDKKKGYCGKPDLVAILKHNPGTGLFDFKTGQAEARSYPIQNAAYRHLASVNDIPTNYGQTIRLKPDGSGTIIRTYPANYQREMNLFQGLLNSYRYFNSK